MRAAVGIWRWRRNPLRRATDLVEAWLALVAALLIVVTAPAAGWITGALAEESLRQSVRVQRLQRHATTATVLAPVTPPRSAAFDPETATASERRWAVRAKWTAPDGSRHTGTLPTTLSAARPGDTFRVWTDRSGRIVPRPMDPATTEVHAALAGVGAALAWGLLVECARRLVLWRLVRRRHADLDRAWAAVGPDWGRAGAGS
ncbi:Rv1733c family protein [Streptomyces xantholiticus]|uniref:Rv1733c family protein n=1 Tax=Streptomyces xantholiticus TaxID=68285 RepID=UPI0016759710|nr:hypothetical protein [Streptomyces xantholiticus]GGW36715.1 hypothetical protein GCM10010381_21700 [Streptomyces xantholiticus]